MATSADIQFYQRNRDGIVEYFIKVVHNGKEWIVKKRYSEFSKLNDYLLKNNIEIKSKFPTKVMWKKNDKKLLNKRLDELRLYFKELTSKYSVSDNSLLKEFLEVEDVFLRLARRTNISETIRLDKIPTLFVKSMIPLPQLLRKSSLSQHNFLPLKKAKSFSVSNRTPLRKDSLSQQSDYNSATNNNTISNTTVMGSTTLVNGTPNRDRKFSIDIFNLSSAAFSMEATNTLQITIKKNAFAKATEALWEHYAKEIYEIDVKDIDEEMHCMERSYLEDNYHFNSSLTSKPILSDEPHLPPPPPISSPDSNGSDDRRSSFQLIVAELYLQDLPQCSPRQLRHIATLEELEKQYPSLGYSHHHSIGSGVPSTSSSSRQNSVPPLPPPPLELRTPSPVGSVRHKLEFIEDAIGYPDIDLIEEVVIRNFKQLDLLSEEERAKLISKKVTPRKRQTTTTTIVKGSPPQHITPSTSQESLSVKNV